jgi:hypothetical protein
MKLGASRALREVCDDTDSHSFRGARATSMSHNGNAVFKNLLDCTFVAR